jgi:hypothetical protein
LREGGDLALGFLGRERRRKRGKGMRLGLGAVLAVSKGWGRVSDLLSQLSAPSKSLSLTHIISALSISLSSGSNMNRATKENQGGESHDFSLSLSPLVWSERKERRGIGVQVRYSS